MYMKPFLSPATDSCLGEASCEFCGRLLLRRVFNKEGKEVWEVMPPHQTIGQIIKDDTIEDSNLPAKID